MGDEVIMSNWHNIWNGRKPQLEKLDSENIEDIFMELKRLTGNDTMKAGGVTYQSFMKQYGRLKEMLMLHQESVESFFEVGCGSGPYLLKLENEGYEIGGMDYAENLVRVADMVLKAPKELYCDEAVNLRTDIVYDAVFSTSAFEYFESDEYAEKVLNRMLKKTNGALGILDVHDIDKREAYIEYRRSTIENYDELYQGLSKKFFPKDFFRNYAKRHGLNIEIEDSCLDGYWNKEFVFDVYMYKKIGDAGNGKRD